MSRGETTTDGQKIPKRIHYCWFSKDKMPPLNQKCVDSWKRCLPEYELVCWDRGRVDSLNARFAQEACSVRAWAFAADYVRLHALFHEGGVYLDSDVEVLRPFDPFLHHSAFSSIEHWPELDAIGIEGAILGAERGQPWIGKCLDYYDNRPFLNSKGERDETIVSGIIADIAAEQFGFSFRVEQQELPTGICIYPPVVFTHVSGPFSAEVTCAVHHCAGSWRQTRKPSIQRRLGRWIRRRLSLR